MARVSLPDSSGSLLPISTYSTRSALRKSLNIETDTTSEQHFTDTSTPSTPSVDRSTDLQESPASSQTSSNIVDTSYTNISLADSATMPPKAKPAKGQRTRATSTPDSSLPTTETKPDRPGRARKPTQKAAELAADGNSKLFKSITERQPSKDIDDGDDEDSHGDFDPLPIDESGGSAVKASGTPKKNIPGAVKQQAASEPVGLSPTRIGSGRKRRRTAEPEAQEKSAPKKTKPTRTRVTRSQSQTPAFETAEGTSIATPEIKTIKPSKKRKHTEESDAVQEAPTKKTKTVDAEVNRTKSKMSVVESVSTVSDPAQAPDTTTKPIRVTRTRKIKTEEPIEDTPAPQSSPKEPSSATKPVRTTKKCKDETQKSTEEAIEPTSTQQKSTKRPRSTIKSNSQTPNTTAPPAPPTTQPTRLKLTLKPPTPTTSTAKKGQTGLPCGLSCLKNERLFYMWAVIATEHEELADEVGAWPGFETDKRSEVWPLKARWNEVLMGFCECEKRRGAPGSAADSIASNGSRRRAES